ncbi:MAG: F0F1 ATP synthase subunit B [Erysipelotrichaceae bacterium]|nr:F0F1 ATP synthase subunit B [Erysipelotrichaceae bacterium]
MEITVDVAGKLFPNIWTLLVQLASTGVLFAVIVKFLWNPGREFIAKKAELTQQELTDARKLKAEAEKDRKEAKLQLSKAGNQAKDIVERGKEEGKIIKEAIIRDGREEADRMLRSAREEISYEEMKMRNNIQKEIVDVAMMATEKLLTGQTDEETNRASIEFMVKEMSGNE